VSIKVERKKKLRRHGEEIHWNKPGRSVMVVVYVLIKTSCFALHRHGDMEKARNLSTDHITRQKLTQGTVGDDRRHIKRLL
jgi:uncharacterized membrane protein